MVLNKFEVFVIYDGMVEVYNVLNLIVVSLFKIVNDVWFFGLGLRFGILEFRLFENEFGLFIMFGKVNFM